MVPWLVRVRAGGPGSCPARNGIRQVTFRVFRASSCALIFVDQAFADRFSADLLCVDIGYGRGVSIAFVSGDALERCPDAAGEVPGRRVAMRRSQVAFIRGAWTAVRRTLVPGGLERPERRVGAGRMQDLPRCGRGLSGYLGGGQGLVTWEAIRAW
jgi:hypothetical protein